MTDDSSLAINRVRDSNLQQNGISILIFSRNDVYAALDLVKEIYDCADQVVIIDSSDAANHKELLKERLRRGFSKLDIYNAVALGTADFLREFGLKKCKHDWVLYLDTDERISKEFRKSLREITRAASLSHEVICAFHVVRIELRESKSWKTILTGPRETRQIRLYNRHCVKYAGILHEQPLVSGRLSILDRKYCIYHYEKVAQEKDLRYYVIERMTHRLRYSDLKTSMKNPFFSHIISICAHVRGKTMFEELTKADYEIHNAVYQIVNRIGGILKGVRTSPFQIFASLSYARHQFSYFFAVPENEARVFLEISAEIRECGGVIKYLLLDQDYVIECLTNGLGEKMWPLDNLRRVLLARHEKGTVYFSSLTV